MKKSEAAMSDQRMRTDECNGVLVVTFLDAGLVEETVHPLRGDLLHLADGRKAVVLDLSAVEFIASAGLGLIVQIALKVSRGGGRLVVCGLRPPLVRLFTGPPRMMMDLPRYDDREAALRALHAM